MKELNRKVIKKPRYLNLMERIGNLYTDKDHFKRYSKPFDFTFVFLILYAFYWLKSLKYFIKS